MVFTITLTNPLASGHDGSWKSDLLMECVVGTLPGGGASSPPANGDSLPQSYSHRDLGVNGNTEVGLDSSSGGSGGGPVGGSGSRGDVAAIANSPSKSPRQPPHPNVNANDIDDVSDDEEDSENSDNEADNTNGQQQQQQQQQQEKRGEVIPSDSVVAEGEAADGGSGSVGESQYSMEVSEDEDDGDDGTVLEHDDALVNGMQGSSDTEPHLSGTPATAARSPAGAAVMAGRVGDRTWAGDGDAAVDKKAAGAKATEDEEGEKSGLLSAQEGGGGADDAAEGSWADDGDAAVDKKATATKEEGGDKSDLSSARVSGGEADDAAEGSWTDDGGAAVDKKATAAKATKEEGGYKSDLSSARASDGGADDAAEGLWADDGDGDAAVDKKATAAKAIKEEGGEKSDLSSARAGGGGAGDAAEGPQNVAAPAPAAAETANLPKAKKMREVVSCLSSSEEEDSSEDETITNAVAVRRKQQAVPTVMPATELGRPLNGAGGGRLPLAPTPPVSPPDSFGRSSIGSLMSPESVMRKTDEGVGSDFSLDRSDEDSWGSSEEGESEDDDSDDYAPDVVPHLCFMMHRDRKTYKKALCQECYEKHVENLRKAKLSMSDNEFDTGRRRKKIARRRRQSREQAGGSGGGGGGGDSACGGKQGAGEKRSRESRRSSNESNGSASHERKKKRRVVRAVAAVPRRLVKPHQKRAKKLVTGGGETAETAVMLLEDTSSSSSDGSAGAGGQGALRCSKGKKKRMAEKPRTNKKANVGSGKQKQGSGSGSGQGVDLLDALIGNAAPARKKTISSTTQSALSRQPEASRSTFSKERAGDAPAAMIGSDGRGRPQQVRGGSLDATNSSLSLAQYKTGAVRRAEVLLPGGVSSSSSVRVPDTTPAGYKIPKVTPKVTPNSVLGKKGGVAGGRQGLKTPAHKGSTVKAKDVPAPLPGTSNRIKAQYEKVLHYVGVRCKRTNGKYFVWVGDQPLDGTEYETATECAKAYDSLYPKASAALGFQKPPKLNFGDARAPSHVESDALTPLVGGKGSRIAKGTMTSGYKPPSQPFFAPKEKPAEPTPRQKPPGAVRGKQPPEAAVAARRRPLEAVAPRKQQHGAAAVLAMIDSPTKGPSSKTGHKEVEPLPPVHGYDKPRNSRVCWSTPIKSDEDLNGRRKLPLASTLPGRSGLAGGRAGLPAPDTRSSCAQTGISGEFSMPREDEEKEENEDTGGVGAESVQVSPAEAIVPARRSPPEPLSDNGPCHEHDDSGEIDGWPREAVAATAAEHTDSSEENGDEEQGRELMMRLMAGHADELGTELVASTMASAAAAEEADGELGGEEEQGRELMMRMFTDSNPPAVSPLAEEEADRTVPRSLRAQTGDDGSSNSSSGEDEDDHVALLEDDPPPPVSTVAWRTPKKTSALGGGSSGSSKTASAKTSVPARSSNTTTSHKPRLTLRSFTRFSGSGAAATGPSPFSVESPLQLPIDNDAHHQRLPDADTMPARPHPPRLAGETIQQVVWRNPRQTATPQTATPTISSGSLDQQHEEQSVQQDDEEIPIPVLQLELPSEVASQGADAMNPDAVPALSMEVPWVSWRPPGRSGRVSSRTAPQQVQRQGFPPAAPTPPPPSSSTCSAEAAPTIHSDEKAEPVEGENCALLPFGSYPFKPPDVRDSVPQSKPDTLARSAARPAASKAVAAAAKLQRQSQDAENGRPETNDVPKESRPTEGGRSRSSSSGPTTRESSSSSSCRSHNTPRQRRPDQAAGDESRRTPRDVHSSRGNESGYGQHRRHDSSRTNNSGRNGPGGRYHDHRDHGSDDFGRGTRDRRGAGSYRNSNNRDQFGRDTRNADRGGSGGYGNDRGGTSGGEGRCGFAGRRFEHDTKSSNRHPRRGRSRSPQRDRRAR